MFRPRRLILVAALMLPAAALMAPHANACGRLAQWQIGISKNCDNPSLCGGGGGGFWGWAEFGSDESNHQDTRWPVMLPSGGSRMSWRFAGSVLRTLFGRG